MLQRIITGVVAIAALIFLLYIRGILLDLVLLAAMLGALWEIHAALKHGGHHPVYWPGAAASLLLFVSLWILGPSVKMALLVLVLCVLATMMIMLTVCCRKRPDWIDAVASIYGIFTVFMPLSMMSLLLHAEQSQGVYLVGLVFVLALCGDTFAYFTGVIFGKHKLCPAVSPNKTIEGAVGGLIGSVVFGIAYAGVMSLIGITFPYTWRLLSLCLIGGVAGQIGDLSASLLKRHCGIKDFGNIFPGHGGIMDRIDSVLFTLMVVCSYSLLFT